MVEAETHGAIIGRIDNEIRRNLLHVASFGLAK